MQYFNIFNNKSQFFILFDCVSCPNTLLSDLSFSCGGDPRHFLSSDCCFKILQKRLARSCCAELTTCKMNATGLCTQFYD